MFSRVPTPSSGMYSVASLVAPLARHVAVVENLRELQWKCDKPAGACELVAARAPASTLLWAAASITKEFRPAMWQSRPLMLAAGRCRELVERPAAALRAALLECRYDR